LLPVFLFLIYLFLVNDVLTFPSAQLRVALSAFSGDEISTFLIDFHRIIAGDITFRSVFDLAAVIHPLPIQIFFLHFFLLESTKIAFPWLSFP
jgi:hypothetical protein